MIIFNTVRIEALRKIKLLFSYGMIMAFPFILAATLVSCDTSVDSNEEVNLEIIDTSDNNLTEIFDIVISRYHEARVQIENLDQEVYGNDYFNDNFYKLKGYNNIAEYYTEIELFYNKLQDLNIGNFVVKKEDTYHLNENYIDYFREYYAEQNINSQNKTTNSSPDGSDCNYGYGDCMESVIITYISAVATSASKACYSCLYYAEAGLWVGILICDQAYDRCIIREDEEVN